MSGRRAFLGARTPLPVVAVANFGFLFHGEPPSQVEAVTCLSPAATPSLKASREAVQENPPSEA